jgi:hypothetical protein
MNISTYRFFIKIAIALSLAVTFTLLMTISTAAVDNKEQASFQAPHVANQHISSGNEASDATPRRNLSESTIEELKNHGPPPAPEDEAVDLPEPPNQVTKPTQKDMRPSGVVYNYIEPPPVNLTARSALSAQFPNLANFSAPLSSLCAIVKDAERYLDEWIDYHFGLGFHTIYLIDNSEKHELLQWQNKRRNAGYSVRVIPKPGTNRQMYGYHMCVSEFREEHEYMAFFDVDEFLVLKKHENVDDFLKEHLPKGALAISWYIFGSGNTTMYAPLPVTKRFMMRDGTSAKDRHEKWNNVKSILKLKDYGGFPSSPHSMKTNRRTTGSNTAWRDTSGGGSFVSDLDACTITSMYTLFCEVTKLTIMGSLRIKLAHQIMTDL